MDLVVFDLDGTLLNKNSQISVYTSDTLKRLSERNIAYTVATGRTYHGARAILDGHHFPLPQAYKNGVMIWHPDTQEYSRGATLEPEEVLCVVNACISEQLTPFVFTLDAHESNTVYHPPIRTPVERELIRSIGIEEEFRVRELDELPVDATVTHINAIGAGEAIKAVVDGVRDEPHLVAYSGVALEGEEWRWLDIHHRDASKGGAISKMKTLLGVERVICFGDSDNDLSMFAEADESYAPDNAQAHIKAAATDVIGHHDADGIARYLRERFAL